MDFDEFIKLKDIEIRDNEHLKVIKCFYPYLRSVSGEEQLLPSLIGSIVGFDLSNVTVETACFNGVNDSSKPPYDNVDLYIKLNNDIKVFVYGRKQEHLAELKENEYVVFLISHDLTGNITQTENHHIFIE
ncbi:MAG: hypothetical protein IJA02_01440 [Clostridia bacterium]|nr:hypothetical protein [Clostridia bacterium]